MWIPELKREKDKAKRRASDLFFSDEYMPNMIIEAITKTFAGGIVRSATKAPKQETNDANGAAKPSLEWSSSFVNEHLSKNHTMLSEVEKLLEKDRETVRPKSPCALVTDVSGKLTDLFAVELNISLLLPFCFPVR